MRAIEVKSLHKSFRPTTSWSDIIRGRFQRDELVALNGVSLSVGPGELVGLAGPNGAGKSTLLRAIGGLLVPNEGTVHVFGQQLVTNEREYKKTVGYALGDERSHFWRLTGVENLRFFAALHGLHGAENRDRIQHVIDVVDLTSVASRPVREYSTGMRQRLSIARGLLGEPKVLLLDEPSRGLDPSAARRIRDFVANELVAIRGVTVVYATHQIDEMRDFCPRMLLMNSGIVVADGPFDAMQDAFAEVFP